MVDEMDLLSGLKPAEPLRPGAFEEARAVLLATMATEEDAPETTTAPRRRSRWGTRRTVGFSVAGLVAAAAAVALVVTSAPAPSHNAAAGGKPSSKATPAASKAAPTAVNPILTQLAGDISVQQVKLPGNATLEIRNQSPTSDQIGDNGVDLYTDNGTYYYAGSEGQLPQVVAQHQDTGQGEFQRDMAAALYAVNGNITTARAKMAIANYAPGYQPGSPQAAINSLKALDKARHVKYTPLKPLTSSQEKEHTDNFIWMNSIDALMAAPENAQVRAGVLRIMATMPLVKVTHTTTAGQPTLTLADSWPLLTDGKLVESLVINASTGFPVALFNTDPGQPLNATYYHVTRVTLANVEAGKF
jgi:hypothetical protein